MTAPVVPPVPAIPAGYAPVPADFTLWVTTPFSFLASTTVFRGELHGTPSWPAAFSLVALDTVLEDPWGGWSGSTFAWTCPAGCAGWYEVTMCALSGSSGGIAQQLPCELYLNGTRYSAASGGWAVSGHNAGSCSPPVPIPLAPGDAVQFWTEPSYATSPPGTAGQYPSMEIAWISA